MIIYIFLIFFIIVTIFLYTNNKTNKLFTLLSFSNQNSFSFIFTFIFIYSSALTILGISGLSHKIGFSGMWTVLIIASSGYVPSLFLGKKFANIANFYKADTLLDLLHLRYRSNLIAILSGMIIFLLTFLLIVTQLVGVKYVLNIAVGNNNLSFFLYIFLICILFIVVGVGQINFFSALLGILVVLASFFLIVLIIHTEGGLEVIKNKIFNLNQEYFSPLGPKEYQISYMYIFSYWIYLGFGVLGTPSKSFGVVKYANCSKLALLCGTIIIFIMTFNMSFIGVLSIPLLGSGYNGDEVLPLIIKKYTSHIVGYILFSIILFTFVGVIKLQLSGLLNTFQYIFLRRFNFGIKKLSIIDKLTVVIVIVIASYFATIYKLNLFNISMFAVGGFAATFTWAVLFIPLKYRFVNKGAAIISIIFGIILYCLLYNSETNWRSIIYPAALPVILNFLVYVVSGYVYYFFTRVFFRIIS